jgi:hypothetical protein
MTDSDLFGHLDDVGALGLTLWAEARGELLDGRVAVGWVVRHRMADQRWPSTVAGVVFQPKQFSCWNPGGDPNALAVRLMGEALLTGRPVGPLVQECLWLARGVLEGVTLDRWPTANHYLTEQLYRLAPPRWATKMIYLGQIGAHVFLQG